jgi:transcriptional regulator with XRE-family HTH domain
MFNIVFSKEYEFAPRALAKMRQSAGLSQQQLADVLERAQSHVFRMETGQRSIEIVEFCRIAHATGHDPAEALAALLVEWAANGCDYRPPAAQSVSAPQSAAN